MKKTLGDILRILAKDLINNEKERKNALIKAERQILKIYRGTR